MDSGVSVLQELFGEQSKGLYFLGEEFSAAGAAVVPTLQGRARERHWQLQGNGREGPFQWTFSR